MASPSEMASPISDQTFPRLCRRAEESNWCTTLYCTTCGAREFRAELQALNEQCLFGLAEALIAADLDELLTVRNWADCVSIALIDLTELGQRARVLDAWLPNIERYVRLADVILFQVVRHMSGPSADRWVDACVRVAANTGDESFMESLLIVRQSAVRANDACVTKARELAEVSPKIARLLARYL